MPRYIFAIQKDSRASESVGVELTDAWTARCQAVQMIADDMRHDATQLWNDEEWHVEVTDETGLILFTVYSMAINAAAGMSK